MVMCLLLLYMTAEAFLSQEKTFLMVLIMRHVGGYCTIYLMDPKLNVVPGCIPSTAVVRTTRVLPNIERVAWVGNAAVAGSKFVI